MSLSGASGSQQASLLIHDGMRAFERGRVVESIETFDRAAALGPPVADRLWQRGLSLYLNNRFAEAALQFRRDVRLNPNDAEEALWCVAAEARTIGLQAARSQMLVVGVDSRPHVQRCLEAFRAGDASRMQSLLAGPLPSDSAVHFYVEMYLGLFSEASCEHDDLRECVEAQEHLSQALKTEYASRSGDYMVSVVRVWHDLRKQARQDL